MIASEYMNSKDVTAANLAAQQSPVASVNWHGPAAVDLSDAAYRRDFADGQRKFWQRLSLSYCANGAERAGFWAAADEEATEQQRYYESERFNHSGNY